MKSVFVLITQQPATILGVFRTWESALAAQQDAVARGIYCRISNEPLLN